MKELQANHALTNNADKKITSPLSHNTKNTGSHSSSSNSTENSRQASPNLNARNGRGNVDLKNQQIQPYPKFYFIKEYLLKPNPRTLSVALICFCTCLVYVITHL